MFHILIAFPDPAQSFTMGAFTSHAAALAYANYYRPYAAKLFSIPCIVAVRAKSQGCRIESISAKP